MINVSLIGIISSSPTHFHSDKIGLIRVTYDPLQHKVYQITSLSAFEIYTFISLLVYYTLSMVYLLWKFSLHSADILLQDLSVPDLLLHLSGFSGISSKHQQTRCQPVQSVDGPQILKVVFFSQDEDNSIVSIATTRVDLTQKNSLQHSFRHLTSDIKIIAPPNIFWE